MKLESINTMPEHALHTSNRVYLPEGLIGIPSVKNLELVYTADQFPFMWLRDTQSDEYAFLVVDPRGLIPDYTVELADADVDFLDIRSSGEILLLNVVTVNSERVHAVTVNLVGPIVVNRSTGVARQVIIENYQEYSTYYPLIADTSTVAVAH